MTTGYEKVDLANSMLRFGAKIVPPCGISMDIAGDGSKGIWEVVSVVCRKDPKTKKDVYILHMKTNWMYDSGTIVCTCPGGLAGMRVHDIPSWCPPPEDWIFLE